MLYKNFKEANSKFNNAIESLYTPIEEIHILGQNLQKLSKDIKFDLEYGIYVCFKETSIIIDKIKYNYTTYYADIDDEEITIKLHYRNLMNVKFKTIILRFEDIDNIHECLRVEKKINYIFD